MIFSNNFMLPQTKILEARTKTCVCVFERIFNESSPKSNTHTLEKYFKNTDANLCSIFQNRRLGSISACKINVITKDGSLRCDVLVFWDARTCWNNFAR